METNQPPPRRRRDSRRWLRSEQTINKQQRQASTDVLRRWRQILGKIESDAARYQLREVEMLAGTTALAIEDALGGTARQTSRSSS